MSKDYKELIDLFGQEYVHTSTIMSNFRCITHSLYHRTVSGTCSEDTHAHTHPAEFKHLYLPVTIEVDFQLFGVKKKLTSSVHVIVISDHVPVNH